MCLCACHTRTSRTVAERNVPRTAVRRAGRRMGLVVRPPAQHACLRSTRGGSNEQRRGERRLWSVPTTVRLQQRGVTHMSGRSATRALVPSGIAGVIALVLYVIIAAATAKNANAPGFSIVVSGVLLGLFTFVVAFIITVIISSFVGRRTQP